MTLLRFKIAWAALIAVLFVTFSTWYGGATKPISAEEGQDLLAQIEQIFGNADESERGFITNIEQMIPRDDGREFYAVNLENLKDGPEAADADRAYAEIVLPLLLKRGGHPIFVSERVGLMLGQYGNRVDRVAVIRYRSLRDMIDIALDPAMKEGEVHKFAALDHTEVFITRPTITFVQVRITFGLFLILLGWLGLRGIDWFAKRTRKSDSA